MSSTMIMLLIIAVTLYIGIVIIMYKLIEISHVTRDVRSTAEQYRRMIHDIQVCQERSLTETTDFYRFYPATWKAFADEINGLIEAAKILTEISKNNTTKLNDLRDCTDTIDETVVTTIRDSYKMLEEIRDDLITVTYIYTKEAANDY